MPHTYWIRDGPTVDPSVNFQPETSPRCVRC